MVEVPKINFSFDRIEKKHRALVQGCLQKKDVQPYFCGEGLQNTLKNLELAAVMVNIPSSIGLHGKFPQVSTVLIDPESTTSKAIHVYQGRQYNLDHLLDLKENLYSSGLGVRIFREEGRTRM